MKVIIIGGGVSGLTAGLKLHENGIDFEILEGDTEYGGRIKNIEWNGYKIDIGAKWFEGLDGNPVWDKYSHLIKNKVKSDWDDCVMYDYTGKVCDINDFDFDSIDEFSIDRQKNKKDDITIKTALYMNNLIPTIENIHIFNCLEFNYYDSEYGNPNITSLYKTCPRNYNNTIKEGVYFTGGNYKNIVDEIAKEIKKKIKCDCKVIKISYDNNKCKVHTNDKIYECDYVICTVSLGVLKNKLIKFEPELPEWKLENFNTMEMSSFNIIFVKFDKCDYEWSKETYLYADLRRGYYPYWINLTLDKYYGKKSNLFCIIVSGDEAIRLELILDKEIIKKEINTIARLMLGEEINVADVYIPKWNSNELYKGTFSNWPVDLSNKEFEIMKKPINNLYFAGEHTSEKYNGYVHGAYISGIDVADKIINKIKYKPNYLIYLLIKLKQYLLLIILFLLICFIGHLLV